MSWIDGLLARDILPDAVIRFGIRRLLAQRLRDEDPGYALFKKCFLYIQDNCHGEVHRVRQR
jgi:hypothetical protein